MTLRLDRLGQMMLEPHIEKMLVLEMSQEIGDSQYRVSKDAIPP